MTFDVFETGKRIKNLREAKHMTQYDLAVEVSVSHGQMSKIEKGARMASVDVYVAIAEYFGVSLDYLLMGKSRNVEARTRISDAIDILKKVECTL